MRTNAKNIKCLSFLFLTILMMFVFCDLSSALPEGESVQTGDVTFQRQTDTLNIYQDSPQAIINYDSFSIQTSETVNFLQPDSSATALNRVTGVDPSEILGNLNANGQIWLINPNGVFFGPGSRVDVAGILASTLNISDEDFLNGNYVFSQSGNGHVINYGDIIAGDAGSVILLSDVIENHGSICANLGKVVLAGGEKITLDISGDDLLSVVVNEDVMQNASGKTDQILNAGEITSDGGTVIISAQQANEIFDNAVNQTGLVRASSMVEHDGLIEFVSDNGVILNNGELNVSASHADADGGTINLEGYRVGQFGDAHADSAGGDGGHIHLYADDAVALTQGSLTTANAQSTGNGGEVIVYSPGNALFWGGAAIETKGGSRSGNGGFIEISGLKDFVVDGEINTLAPNGLSGTFLIDPNNIEIVAGETSTNMNTAGQPWVSTDDTAEIGVTNVVNYLTGTGNLEIATAAAGGNSQDGDITLSAALDYNGIGTTRTLTLDADNDIIINGVISDGTPGGGDTLTLVLEAGGNIDINQPITTNNGEFNATCASFDNTGGAITLNSNYFYLTTDSIVVGANISAYGEFLIQPATVDRSIGIGDGAAGDLNLTAAEVANLQNDYASLFIGRSNSSGAIDIGAVTFDGPVIIRSPSAGGSMTVNGKITGTDDATITLSAANGITLNADIETAGENLIISNSAVIGEGNSITLSTGAASSGSVLLQGTVNGTAGGGAENLTLISGTGNVTVSGIVGGTAPLGTLTLQADNASATGTVTFNGAVTTGSLVTFGRAYDIWFKNGGTVTNDTNFLNTGDLYLNTSDANTMTFNGGLATTGNASNPSDVSIAGTVQTSNDQIDLGAINVIDDAIINSGTAAANVGAVTLADGVTLTLQDGDASGGATSISSVAGTAGGTASNLTVNSTGTASIGVVGTDIGTLTVTQSNGTTFSSTVDATTVTLTDTSDGQTVAFQGNLTATTLNTANQAYNVSMTGSSNTITNDVSFLNTGTITIGNASGDISTFNGGLDTSAGATTACGTIRTSGDQIDIAALTLSGGDLTIDATNNGGSTAGAAINITGAVDGAVNLTLNSGTSGDITFSSNVGSTTDLSSFTITNANDVSLEKVTTTGAFTQSAGAGTTTLNDTVTAGGDVSITTKAITFVGSIDTSSTPSNVTLTTSTGNITSGAAAQDILAQDATLTSSSGIIGTEANPVAVTLTGTLTVSPGGVASGVSGAFSGTTANSSLTISNSPPGIVLWNGSDFSTLSSIANQAALSEIFILITDKYLEKIFSENRIIYKPLFDPEFDEMVEIAFEQYHLKKIP